jgi:predicted phage terminase large subunit-like protein
MTTWCSVQATLSDASNNVDVAAREADALPPLEWRLVYHRRAVAAHADVVLIEEKASGIQLLQELREAQVRGVKGYEPKGDKAMRLYAQCATIENGGLWLPTDAPWLAEYIHELTTFPGSKHDDMVDATSQVLEWLKIGQKGMGLFYFYKRLYGETVARQRGDLPPLSPT